MMTYRENKRDFFLFIRWFLVSMEKLCQTCLGIHETKTSGALIWKATSCIVGKYLIFFGFTLPHWFSLLKKKNERYHHCQKSELSEEDAGHSITFLRRSIFLRDRDIYFCYCLEFTSAISQQCQLWQKTKIMHDIGKLLALLQIYGKSSLEFVLLGTIKLSN